MGLTVTSKSYELYLEGVRGCQRLETVVKLNSLELCGEVQNFAITQIALSENFLIT